MVQEQTMGADARDGGGRGDSRSGIQGGAGIGPLMILLIALAIMIGIGIWISRGSLFNVAGMTQNTARMEASTLQQTGSSISSAFGAAMFRDSFLPDQITFDTAARTSSSVGIFNPADGFMAKPPIQLSALTAGTLSGSDIVWQRMQATIPEVGTGATYVTVLPGIRTQVCQAINSAKWGTPPSDPVPVASNVSSNNVTAGLGNTTAVGNVTLDLSATSPAAWSDRRDEGCMASSDGVNFYFKVISVS